MSANCQRERHKEFNEFKIEEGVSNGPEDLDLLTACKKDEFSLADISQNPTSEDQWRRVLSGLPVTCTLQHLPLGDALIL